MICLLLKNPQALRLRLSQTTSHLTSGTLQEKIGDGLRIKESQPTATENQLTASGPRLARGECTRECRYPSSFATSSSILGLDSASYQNQSILSPSFTSRQAISGQHLCGLSGSGGGWVTVLALHHQAFRMKHPLYQQDSQKQLMPAYLPTFLSKHLLSTKRHQAHCFHCWAAHHLSSLTCTAGQIGPAAQSAFSTVDLSASDCPVGWCKSQRITPIQRLRVGQ